MSNFAGRVEARARRQEMQRMQEQTGMWIKDDNKNNGDEETALEEGYLKVIKRVCQCMKGCTEREYNEIEKKLHPLFRSLNT